MIAPSPILRGRNIRATIAVLNGASFTAVGRDIGVCNQRVHQIYGMTLRAAINAYPDEDIPCGISDRDEMRKHKDYWIHLLNKLAKQWHKLNII